MIDLRGISTNWFKNQLCPSTRLSGYGLCRGEKDSIQREWKEAHKGQDGFSLFRNF
jgi:hypothetical protein